MELKKNPKADLQKMRGLFTEIGFVVVLGICIVAFEWSSQDVKRPSISFESDIVEDEMIQATQQEEFKQQEKPVAPVLSDVMVVVDNNVKLSNEMDFFSVEDNKEEIKVPEYKVPDEQLVEEDIPLVSIETPPTFNGGDQEVFRAWVNENLKYPKTAEGRRIQGRVIVRFTVSSTGDVTDVKVLRSSDPLLDKEAIRVVTSSPKWTPGKQRDKAIRVVYLIPIIFNLN